MFGACGPHIAVQCQPVPLSLLREVTVGDRAEPAGSGARAFLQVTMAMY